MGGCMCVHVHMRLCRCMCTHIFVCSGYAHEAASLFSNCSGGTRMPSQVNAVLEAMPKSTLKPILCIVHIFAYGISNAVLTRFSVYSPSDHLKGQRGAGGDAQVHAQAGGRGGRAGRHPHLPHNVGTGAHILDIRMYLISGSLLALDDSRTYRTMCARRAGEADGARVLAYRCCCQKSIAAPLSAPACCRGCGRPTTTAATAAATTTDAAAATTKTTPQVHVQCHDAARSGAARAQVPAQVTRARAHLTRRAGGRCL